MTKIQEDDKFNQFEKSERSVGCFEWFTKIKWFECVE